VTGGKLIRLDLATKEATTLRKEDYSMNEWEPFHHAHVCLHEIDLAMLLQASKTF
jgi:hypothetical protein